jgi:hypothetical protein
MSFNAHAGGVCSVATQPNTYLVLCVGTMCRTIYLLKKLSKYKYFTYGVAASGVLMGGPNWEN